jgi:osmoprotectant transport system permease protein
MDLITFLRQSYNWDPNNPDNIPTLLWDHASIVLISMGIALLIAFPIALLITRYTRLYLPTVSFAGVLYSLPSVALIGILIATTHLIDNTVIIIPLVLYAQIVLIRNIVAAIRSVDPELIEVGRAMGMNDLQILRRVTLPLALPVIVAGVRVATVTSIGITTIAAGVGIPNLGTLIFDGLEPIYPVEVLAGAVLVTLFALLADAALLGVQRALSRGRPEMAGRSAR